MQRKVILVFPESITTGSSTMTSYDQLTFLFLFAEKHYYHDKKRLLKGSRMGRSDKVSLWCASLLINTRFRFLYLRISNCKRI